MNNWKIKTLFGRAKHLLITFNKDWFRSFKATGFVIRSLLKILNEKCEKLQVDVALILYEKDVYVAAQKERARLTPYKYKLFLHKYLFDSIDELSQVLLLVIALFIGIGMQVWVLDCIMVKVITDLSVSLDMVQFKKLGYLIGKIIDRNYKDQKVW